MQPLLSLLQLDLSDLLIALLVFSRIGGMVLAMPGITTHVSWRLRIVITLSITAVLVPGLVDTESASVAGLLGESSWTMLIVNMAAAAGRELILGMIIGGVVQLLVSGVQLAGEMIATVSGIPLGGIEGSGEQGTPALSRLIGLLAVAVMMLAGGHRALVSALLDSFSGVAPGDASINQPLIELIIDQLTKGMGAGLRVAAPVCLTLIATQLLVGLISRTMPQINIFAVGLNLNVLAMLVVTALTIGSAGLIFQEELSLATEQLHGLW
ncbi:flagellar biosynthetic protein FliR [Stieleria varia]|uniref:Flagellar biosynthesis protein FliR n=1 Tax=Stieleria varia TaxID=2528005 RepID=A0A5C6AE60_9BACT|nr:flagellar biosynthetic protein FliR [Stieleria varia]TWT98332.1 flagellar biosynthesis protein FliR [Stieleria varia]